MCVQTLRYSWTHCLLLSTCKICYLRISFFFVSSLALIFFTIYSCYILRKTHPSPRVRIENCLIQSRTDSVFTSGRSFSLEQIINLIDHDTKGHFHQPFACRLLGWFRFLSNERAVPPRIDETDKEGQSPNRANCSKSLA